MSCGLWLGYFASMEAFLSCCGYAAAKPCDPMLTFCIMDCDPMLALPQSPCIDKPCWACDPILALLMKRGFAPPNPFALPLIEKTGSRPVTELKPVACIGTI